MDDPPEQTVSPVKVFSDGESFDSEIKIQAQLTENI